MPSPWGDSGSISSGAASLISMTWVDGTFPSTSAPCVVARRGRILRLALVSVHGCPQLPLGKRDSGGMNVYVREVSRELGRRGHQVDVYTRQHGAELAQVEVLGPRVRVIHIPAGPPELDKEAIHHYLPEFSAGLIEFCRQHGLSYDVIHSHYWLSGLVGVELAR